MVLGWASWCIGRHFFPDSSEVLGSNLGQSSMYETSRIKLAGTPSCDYIDNKVLKKIVLRNSELKLHHTVISNMYPLEVRQPRSELQQINHLEGTL